MQKIFYSFGRRTRLNIFEGAGPNSISGIRATIYGGTGFMGPFMGTVIGQLGSDVIFPHNHMYGYNDELKELKLCAVTGQSVLLKKMDFDDSNMIDWTMQNSNVVVNLLGPRRNLKTLSDFEYINIEVPRRLAEACQKNPNVIRMIHFSSAGASPDSPSMDLRTKYFGEQEVNFTNNYIQKVLKAFPNATIFKPCTVVGMNDNLVRRIVSQREYLYNFNVVFDDCTAKKQPILVNDVAFALLNALKMPETVGQTYELGGPHVYSMLQIYETIFNYIERPPHLVHFPKASALWLAQRIPNWNHFNTEMIVRDGCDVVCSPGSKQIDQLYVRPVSLPSMLPRILADNRRRAAHQSALEER